MYLIPNQRRFILNRTKDVSGISGTGERIAEGCQFSDSSCVIRFLSPVGSTNVFSSIEAVKSVHGHGSDSQIIWLDDDNHPTILASEMELSKEILPEKCPACDGKPVTGGSVQDGLKVCKKCKGTGIKKVKKTIK